MERIELRRQQKLMASMNTQPAVEEEKFAGTIPSDNESIEIGLTDGQRASFEKEVLAAKRQLSRLARGLPIPQNPKCVISK